MGENIKLSLFGESHGEAIGCVIEGLPAGVKLDIDYIRSQLDLRKPKGKISTARKEADDFKIVSGYFNEHTTGTPLTIIIENSNTKSHDYTPENLRPSHADYTAYEKYNGYQDYRGGGHFSGRITAPLVAVGAIALQILTDLNVTLGTHILKCNGFKDTSFDFDQKVLKNQINDVNSKYFPLLNEQTATSLLESIEEVAKNGDSVGGVLESAILGLEPGIGEPFWNSIESTLSKLLFSIPAVKGVEFGLGFEFANYKGSKVNDEFICENGKISTKTNNNGGINGGISNGMPIILKTVIKPTPSIFKEQNTVNFDKKENIKHTINGRHDPAIIHRARVVVDSVLAIGILDLLMSKYGHNIVLKTQKED